MLTYDEKPTKVELFQELLDSALADLADRAVRDGHDPDTLGWYDSEWRDPTRHMRPQTFELRHRGTGQVLARIVVTDLVAHLRFRATYGDELLADVAL